MLYRAGPIQTNQICQFSFKLSISPFNIKCHCIIIYNPRVLWRVEPVKAFRDIGANCQKTAGSPFSRCFFGGHRETIQPLTSPIGTDPIPVVPRHLRPYPIGIQHLRH